MKMSIRQNLLIGIPIVFFLLFNMQVNCFAGGTLKSTQGYWDFDGHAEIVEHQGNTLKIQIIVHNRSTDNSYKSGKCLKGMASCAVDWEVWHTDAGMLSSGQTRFQDVCNAKAERNFELIQIPNKYSVLEVRFNITTPNGGHSYKRGRVKWR